MTVDKSVSVERMPPLVEISEVLACRGWKIDAHSTERIVAKKVKRPPSYTVGDGVTWLIEFARRDGGGEITVTIPAMVSSVYVEKRVLNTVRTLLDATDRDYEVSESLDFDVLARLRPDRFGDGETATE